MSSTRDFTSLGVWAKDATTNIPIHPVDGVAYRNAAYTKSENEAGDGYDTKPNSANFNQKMFIITSFIDLINKNGLPGWSNLVDYDVPAIVWGSDGNFYFSIAASGPSTAVKDPISSPDYWELVTTSSSLALDLANQTPGYEGDRSVGYTNETVQEALDNLNNGVTNLNGFRVLMAGRFSGATGVALGDVYNIKNNSAIVYTTIDHGYTVVQYTIEDNNLIAFDLGNSLLFVSVDGYTDSGTVYPVVTAIERGAGDVINVFTLQQFPYRGQTAQLQNSLTQDFNIIVVDLNTGPLP
jgi:hypothetical protein